MEKNLLFFDIDGTLACPGQNPSERTVSAIRRARAKGHKVFLGTGRSKASVPEAVWEIGFDGGIYSAGGHVEAGEIGLPVSSNSLILPCGASGRWTGSLQ